MMFKVIIAGSRGFSNYSLLKRKMDDLLSNIVDDIEIIEGGAIGADRLGKQYGNENGFKVTTMNADWSIGKSAGYLRNEQMARYVAPDGACVCFWDGKSLGTGHMIDLSKKYKLKLRIVMV